MPTFAATTAICATWSVTPYNHAPLASLPRGMPALDAGRGRGRWPRALDAGRAQGCLLPEVARDGGSGLPASGAPGNRGTREPRQINQPLDRPALERFGVSWHLSYYPRAIECRGPRPARLRCLRQGISLASIVDELGCSLDKYLSLETYGANAPFDDARLIGARIDIAMSVPTTHLLVRGNARDLSFIKSGSIPLAVTSRPYWDIVQFEHYAQPAEFSSCEGTIGRRVGGRCSTSCAVPRCCVATAAVGRRTLTRCSMRS